MKHWILLILYCLLYLPMKAQVTFNTPASITMPSNSQKLAKGDFNNDGLIDLIACNSFNLTILLNTGTGTFTGTNKRNFASPSSTLNVAVGDFNEDGNLDAVSVSQTNDNFSLLLGDGTGNLSAPVNFAIGDAPQGIEVADFNKDNNLDVIVSNRGTPQDVRIFPGTGTGSFGAPTIIPIVVFDVAVGDFNNDTNPDFAIGSGTTVQIWLGDGSGITFTLGSSITGFGVGGQDVMSADVDDDGDLDIIAASGYSLNDGVGNFSARRVLASTGYNYVVGDLNKDGIPDIVSNDTSQNGPNMRVFLGDGAGNFTLLAKFGSNVNFRGLEIVDVNGDSNPDVIGVGGATSVAVVLLGDGTGYFTNTVVKYITPTDPQDLVKGDFNEDGQIDIAICHSAGNIISIHLGQGGGKFSKTATNYATGTFPFQIIAIDFNKDNHLDLITYNQTAGSLTVLTGIGNGQFSAAGNFSTVPSGRFTYGDFNNDTFVDVVVSGSTANVISFLAGNGSGFNAAVSIPVSERVYEIKAIDFNNDGNLDLVGDFDSGLGTLTGNGTGAFIEGTARVLVSGSFFLIADINYDTHQDVIGFSNNSGGNDFFINDGTGVFTGSSISVTLGGFPFAFEDMNGDGFKDLLVGSQLDISSQPGQIVIFRGTATGISNSILVDQDGSGGRRLVVHDLNGDGKLDIVTISFNIYEDYLSTLINTTVPVGCPVITSQPASQSVCEGQNVTLSVAATGNAPLSYQWRKGINNIAGATSPGLTLTGVTLADAASYSCVVSNGCGSVTSSTATLTINAIPNVPVAPSPVTRCGTGSVTLSTSGGTNGQYRWYTQATGGTALSGAVNDTYITGVLSTSVTYYVALSNGTCESNRTAIPVTLNPLPAVPVIVSSVTPVGNSITVCSSATLTLNAPTGFAAYLWSNGSTLQQISITTSAAYSVTVTDASGCISPASDVINITIIPAPCNNQPPAINPTNSSTVIGGLATINLLDLISDADNNLVLSSLAITQQPTSGASATIVNGVLVIDYKGVNFSGRDRVTIVVCDVFGACTQQVLEIDVIGDIEVYNGLSPNGDEQNDIFLIRYIDLLPDAQQNKVTIYNRWGSKVFEVSNYNNTTNVFRGLNDNGNELPSGTYFYKIEFPEGRESITGYLSIKR